MNVPPYFPTAVLRGRKISAFVDLMRPLGLVDVSRTGVVAISRGPDAI